MIPVAIHSIVRWIQILPGFAGVSHVALKEILASPKPTFALIGIAKALREGAAAGGIVAIMGRTPCRAEQETYLRQVNDLFDRLGEESERAGVRWWELRP